MSWNRFSKLQDQQKMVIADGKASSASQKNFRQGYGLLPHGMKDGIGVNKKLPEAATEFMKKQEAALARYEVDPKFWLPSWVRGHLDNKGSVESLVREIVDRVEKDPHHKTLQEAHYLLNELGRDPDNCLILRKHITNKLMRKIAHGPGRPNN